MKILISGKGDCKNYVRAFEAVGAEVSVASALDNAESFGGLVLCGGGDIDPRYYGEAACGSVNIEPQRDEMEFHLIENFVGRGIPVLGICRGHQLINVFFGGSLYQHMPHSEHHCSGADYDLIHLVEAVPGSITKGLYGGSFSVNSYHHQAVKSLGRGLMASAYWNGNFVEAIEHTALPVIGVQWHPERMLLDGEGGWAASGIRLFKYFVSLCGKT